MTAEIVIGVNHTKTNSYKKLRYLIVESDGKIVDTVSMGGARSWTPAVEAKYNITAYVPPAPSDDNPYNKKATTLVVAMYPLIHPIER